MVHPRDSGRNARSNWVVLISALVAAAVLEAGLARASSVLLAAVALTAIAAAQAGMLRTWRSRLRLSLLIAATLAFQVAPALLGSHGPAAWEFARLTSYCLLGWAAVLAVLALPADAASVPLQDPPPWCRVGAVLAVVAGLALVHYAIRDRYAQYADEALYLLQGELIQNGQLGRPLEPALAPHLLLKQSYVSAYGLTGQYPPGWPLLLAAFGAARLRWWAGVATGLIGVVATYGLGARLRSRAVGFLAAAILASGSWFLAQAGTYFAHVPTLALCAAAAYLMLPGRETHPAAPGRWAVAGLMLGWAVATRPMTGAALGVGIWWWSIAQLPAAAARRGTVALLLGSLLPLWGLLAYNAATNGSPLRFGYEAAGSQGLGFGIRGVTVYNGTGQPRLDAQPFGPVDAVQHTLRMLAEAARDFGPISALAPLVLLSGSLGGRISWRRVVPFLLLPAAQFGYYYEHVRFYVELLPFLALGVAMMIADIRGVSLSRARALTVLFVAGQLLFAGVRVQRDAATYRRGYLPYFRAVASAAKRDSVLVVVWDDDRHESVLNALWWFNVGSFPGRAVVARDTRAGDAALVRAFPGRRALWLHDVGKEQPPQPRLVPLGALHRP
jgi:hypothetical protein